MSRIRSWWRATTGAFLPLVALLVAPGGVAVAQQTRTGTLGGEVRSSVTGQPVPGVDVSVDGTSLHAESDGAGRFLIEGIGAGTCTLLVTRTGFIPLQQADVVVMSGRHTSLSLKLQEQLRLDEQVRVAASYFARPDDVATSAFSINSEELRRAPGALGDVSRVVQSLPGLSARDDQRNDIVARGGSPSENLVLVDGFEAPAISHFAAYGASGGSLSMLDSEVVSDVRFLAGGFPAPYGDRLSSVLEVDVREGSRERFQGELEIGISGAGLVAEGPLGRHGTFLATARRSYLELIAGPFGVKDIPEYSNYLGKVTLELSPRHQLSLVSFGGYDRLQEDVPMSDLDNPDTITTDYRSGRTVAGLKLRSLFGTHGVGTFSLAHAQSTYRIDSWDKMLAAQQVERNRTSDGQTTAKYDLVYEVPGRGSVRAGVSAKRVDSWLDLGQPLGVDNPYSADPTRINAVALKIHRVTSQLGGYLDLTTRIGGRVAFTLGGRIEHYGLASATRVSPRAGLVVHVSERIDVSASAGRYTQMPPLALLEASPGNAELSPIRADHYVAGIAFRPWSDLRISLEAYHKRYGEYPVSTQIPSLTFADFGEQYDAAFLMPMKSVGTGRSSGIELHVQKKLSRAVWGQLSYAWSRSEQRALDAVVRPGTYDLPHVASLIAGWRVGGGFELSGKFSYTSGRPVTPYLADESSAQNRGVFDTTRIHAQRAPAYHRLDVRADKRFGLRWGGIVLYVEAENLYDRQNVRRYTWNQKTNERQAWTQLPLLVLGGINLEF